jgi:hypothetical protein
VAMGLTRRQISTEDDPLQTSAAQDHCGAAASSFIRCPVTDQPAPSRRAEALKIIADEAYGIARDAMPSLGRL